MENEKSDIIFGAKTLAVIGANLLKQLDPEIEYVKQLLNEEIADLLAGNKWKEQQGMDKPWLRSLERGRYRLKIAIIHARKGEHNTGADLVFELKDKKILFLQSKRVGSDNRIHFDRLQLKKLTDLELQICLWNNSGTFQLPCQNCLCLPKKAAFYHLIMKDHFQGWVEERFFHISEITSVLGSRKSTAQDEFLHGGLEQEKFDEMFWKCTIGGPDIKEERKKGILEFYSLITNRMVIWLHVEMKTPP